MVPKVKYGFARTLLCAVSAVGVSLTILAGRADAAGGYYVTFVARECPSYSDIYADKARNDIDESLQNLGPNTQYRNNGALVSPTYEDIGPQLNCRPLVSWAFTLGTGFQIRTVTGPWGSMSRVTNPYRTAILTRRSTPLLDDKGNRLVGAAAIPGAVTLKLTGEQASQTARSRLWVQGGAPANPVLARAYGKPSAPAYGFGTLRCATDDVNSDNVAYLFFPAGVNHVFCYAYYVAPPPPSGTIVIRERVEGPPAGADPAFAFTGDVSYDPNGFTLKSGQSIAFYRGGGATWQVAESTVSHYELESVDCASSTGASVASTDTSPSSTRDTTASVALAAGDTVNCTFVNRWVPAVGSLTIFNTTLGGVGSFGYIVEPYNDDPTLVTAISSRNSVPVEARPERNLALLATKPYFIEELRPADPAGRWTLVSAECGGIPRKVRDMPLGNVKEIALRIVFGKDTVCHFVNRFTPAGSITLSDVTEGGAGTAAFVIQPLEATPQQFRQFATSHHEDAAAVAAPDAPTDATDHVDLGTYLITEQPPPNAPAGNEWNLNAVTCNGRQMSLRRGSVTVTLKRRASHLACEFTNRLRRSSGRARRAATGRTDASERNLADLHRATPINWLAWVPGIGTGSMSPTDAQRD
jgi:hypothetical protein